MQVRDQLDKLLRIQGIVEKARAARRVECDAPGRLEEIENRFRERNAEYVAVKERYDALDDDQRKRAGDLEELEEHKTKYMDDLMQVQNQREYAAMLKEIDTVKAQISENEEAILTDLLLEPNNLCRGSTIHQVVRALHRVAAVRVGTDQRAALPVVIGHGRADPDEEAGSIAGRQAPGVTAQQAGET